MTQQRAAATQITSRLFAHVSHDLGSPVSTLRGYIKMVLDGRAGPLTEEQKEYLTIALESAERLVSLAKRVSKMPDFIDRLHAEAFDLCGEWEETVNARRPALLEKAIRIQEHSSVDRLIVAGDRQQLRQVFERIIDVALESARQGDEMVARFSRGRAQDIIVRIGLSGAGLTTTTDLSAIHNIILLHGGTLSLEHQSATGSICIINLPEAA